MGGVVCQRGRDEVGDGGVTYDTSAVLSWESRQCDIGVLGHGDRAKSWVLSLPASVFHAAWGSSAPRISWHIMLFMSMENRPRYPDGYWVRIQYSTYTRLLPDPNPFRLIAPCNTSHIRSVFVERLAQRGRQSITWARELEIDSALSPIRICRPHLTPGNHSLTHYQCQCIPMTAAALHSHSLDLRSPSSILLIAVSLLLMCCPKVSHEDQSLLRSNQNNDGIVNTATIENVTAQKADTPELLLLL